MKRALLPAVLLAALPAGALELGLEDVEAAARAAAAETAQVLRAARGELRSDADAASAEEGGWARVPEPKGPARESDPAAGEKRSFWEKARQGVVWDSLAEEVCRRGKLPLAKSFRAAEVIEARPAFVRSLRRMPFGGLALVDSVELRLRLGHAVVLAEPGVPVTLSAGIDVDGRSLVVRPLQGARACGELDALVDVRTVKLALPFDADRFREMEVGEVWKVPARLRAWVRPGVGTGFAGGGAGVAFGYSRDGGLSLTLRRLDRNRLRLRLRLDHAEVYDLGGEAAFRIGAEDFDRYSGLGEDAAVDALGRAAGRGAAWRLADRNLVRPLARWLTARLGLLAQWSDGDQAVLEFVLDPEDAAQMRRLEQALDDGDLPLFGTLAQGAKSVGKAFAGQRADRAGLRDAAGAYSRTLERRPDFAATMSFERRRVPFGVRVPFILDAGVSAGRDSERIETLEGGDTVRLYRAQRDNRMGFFDVPFLGSFVRSDERRSVMAAARQAPGSAEAEPVLVYVQQAALAMHDESAVRELAELAGSVLGLAGGGSDPRTRLEADAVLGPAAPAGQERTYDRATAALTVVLAPAALREIASSTAEQVARAYARAAGRDWQGLMEAVLETGGFGDDGQPRVDEQRLKAAGWTASREDLDRVRLQFGEAKAIHAALGRIGGPAHEQAKAWRDLLTGPYWSWPGYERTLKVLIQLTRPAAVSAELVFSAEERGKGKPKAHGRWLLHPSAATGEVERIWEAAARFATPSDLED